MEPRDYKSGDVLIISSGVNRDIWSILDKNIKKLNKERNRVPSISSPRMRKIKI